MAEPVDIPPPPLVARLLGHTELRLGDRLLTDADWPRRSARHLLLLLLVSPGHALPRDRVVDLIWPEAAPQTAANVVALAVHRLRRALEPELDSGRASRYVETAAGSIRLHLPPGSRVDADAFEADLRDARRQADQGRRQPLRVALAAYAGDLVADEPYVDWLVARREQLAQLRKGAVVELAALDLVAGEPLAAEPALLDLLRDDPSLEDAHRALVRAYAAAGKQERAERQLEACRSALREHLGVDPAPETLAAVDRVPLVGLTTVKSRGHVPGPPTRLIGRQRELGRIADLILGGESRLVTLVGPGGIGKTHLAQEAAGSLEGDFADGAVWVPLASLRDPALIPAAFARALDVTDDGSAPLEETLVRAVADRALLLVVDNLEQVLDGAPILARLLASSPGSAVLATSRQRLHLRGEHVLEVEPLPASTDGVALFVARAVEAGVRLPTDDVPSGVVEICRRLDGIPLAIELAAGAARRLTVDQVLDRMGQRLDLLIDGPRDADPRQRTMRAAIAWSDDLLTPAQQITFRRLGIFAGGAPRDLIDEVVGPGLDGVLSPTTAVVDADLAALVDAHLLRKEDAGAGPRYEMLETVRAYAVERLASVGELRAIADAHGASIVRLADLSEAGAVGPDQIAWLDRMEADHANLRAAVAWSIDQGDPDDALRIVGAAWQFFSTHGHRTEWAGRIERVLAAAEESAPLARARALRAAGILRDDLGDYDLAEAHYEAAFALLPLGPETAPLRGHMSNDLGNLDRARARFAEARAHYEDTLHIAAEASMPRVVLTAEASLGNIAYFEGDLDEAARRYTATLAATDDPAYRRVILQNLASVLFERGDYEQARALQDEGLLLAREAGDRKATGDLLVGLANTADQLGDQDRGGRLRSEAIAQFVAIGDRAGEAAARMSEAGVLRQNGDLLGSVATLERALLLMREIGDELACVEILELLGRPLGQLGRSALAARFVGAADAIRSHRRLARLPQAERSHQETLAELAAAMPTTAQAAAMAVGAQLSLQAALDEALTVCQEIRSS